MKKFLTKMLKRFNMKAHHGGKCAGAIMLAIIIAVSTLVLQLMNFGPLTNLLVREEQAYRLLLPENPSYEAHYKPAPVVFLEIDQPAVDNWKPRTFTPSCGGSMEMKAPARAQERSIMQGTPRGLIAALTSALRKANAAVIYLDYDLRNKMDDDDFLQTELACKSAVPVLLPQLFVRGRNPPCPESAEADRSDVTREIGTLFDRSGDGASVAFVHPLLQARDYGLVDSVCLGYPVPESPGHRPWLAAAMAQAVVITDQRLLKKRDQVPMFGWRPIRLWVDSKTVRLPREKDAGPLAYFHVDASLLLDGGSLRTELLEDDLLRNAIIVVGSTHDTAGDTYATPVGELPGALIHANIAIDLQTRLPLVLPDPIGFIIELVILFLAIIGTAIAKRRLVKPHHDGSSLKILKEEAVEYLVELIVMLFVASAVYLLAVLIRLIIERPLKLEFSITNIIVGILIAFILQAVASTTKAVEAWTEQVLMEEESMDAHVGVDTPAEEPNVGTPAEEITVIVATSGRRVF